MFSNNWTCEFLLSETCVDGSYSTVKITGCLYKSTFCCMPVKCNFIHLKKLIYALTVSVFEHFQNMSALHSVLQLHVASQNTDGGLKIMLTSCSCYAVWNSRDLGTWDTLTPTTVISPSTVLQRVLRPALALNNVTECKLLAVESFKANKIFYVLIWCPIFSAEVWQYT